MASKTILSPERIRRIDGSFAFIEHRFLRDGFFDALDHMELLLYLFLVLVSDRNGLSFYPYDRICNHLRVHLDAYLEARNRLIQRDLIAFNGTLFQVLSLPEHPVDPLTSGLDIHPHVAEADPAAIRKMIEQSLLGGTHD